MADAAPEPRARLAYVLGQFPSVSETFILREIRALEKLGFRITPLSMHPPGDTVLHENAKHLAQRTVYRPHPLAFSSILALIMAPFHGPFGFLAALRFVISHAIREPGATREMVVAFVAACYFKLHVPSGQMRHIHAHFATFPSTVGLVLAEMLGVGFSMSAHARDIFTDEARMMQVKVSGSEFVACCTDYGARQLQKKHGIMETAKIRVIRHGLDFDEFTVGPHVDRGTPLLTSIGRLVEKKGFPILLRSAAILASNGVDFEMALIGDGPLRGELERLLNGLGLAERVHMPGVLPQEEIRGVYRVTDVFALTPIVAASGDRDGLPNVLIEALAAGIPTVATDVGAISELIEHGVTGLLAGPGDVQQIAEYLEEALVNQDLRRRLSANGRALVHRDYDINKNARQLGALFAEILRLRQWPPIPGEGGRLPETPEKKVEL
ncbi:MAG: glycosyltransferase [Armatimonadota bacterium]